MLNVRRLVLEGHTLLIADGNVIALLAAALDELHECCGLNDGMTHSELGCGNCEAGTPTPHSLGCSIRAAIHQAVK